MLPSPAELRALSERIREAVEKAPSGELKEQLEAYAFRLTQVAEQVEREGGLAAVALNANVERYERLHAGTLESKTRSTVEALLEEKNAGLEREARQISAWRLRAEEIRTVADQFFAPSVQGTLRRTAANLDAMADHAEGLLADKKAPSEKIG